MLNKTTYSSYLPIPHDTKTYFTIPINELNPEALKQSAKIVQDKHCNLIGNYIKKDRVSHTTILNQTVKALGFKDGFSGYNKAGWFELSNFLREKGLVHHADLISIDNNDLGFRLGRRQVSDRLFLGESCPTKIFTGYNVNWRDYDCIRNSSCGTHYDFLNYYSKSEDELVKDPELRRIFLKASYITNLSCGSHLLDDTFIQPRLSSEILIQLYDRGASLSDYNSSSDIALEQMLFVKMFRHEIDSLETGWVDIIPFNDNLIFLKGEGGKYDFVFRNLRDIDPPGQPFSNGLKFDDIPKSFLWAGMFYYRYYYMEGQWDDKKHHQAAKYFFSSCADGEIYTGASETLQALYQWNRSTHIAAANALIPEGFHDVHTSGCKKIYVQKRPVSISEFRRFMCTSGYGYSNRRLTNVENPWEPANLDDPELPACVTYYDALAYVRWLEKEYDIPLRLLTIEEYRMIHPRLKVGTWAEHRSAKPGIIFNLPDGTDVDVLDSSHFKIPKEKWMQIEAHYTDAYNWINGKGGVQFFECHDFAEWLFENNMHHDAAAIRTTTLTGVRSENIRLGYHPMESWGKYKHCKIGFRVCFEMGGGKFLSDIKPATK